MIITILAYKPDSIDTCRGCVTARYSADFAWKSSMDRSAMAEFLGGLLWYNMHLDRGEDGYEFTFLFNGEEENGNWDLTCVRECLEKKAKELADVKETEYKQKEEAKQLQAKAKEKQNQEEQERQQLMALQKKWGTCDSHKSPHPQNVLCKNFKPLAETLPVLVESK
jgi:hypothetical protein